MTLIHELVHHLSGNYLEPMDNQQREQMEEETDETAQHIFHNSILGIIYHGKKTTI